MGYIATPEFLIARWNELCRDPSLEDLPYKIELNAWGKVEMSPASYRHGRLQIELGAELTRQLPNGVAASECSHPHRHRHPGPGRRLGLGATS